MVPVGNVYSRSYEVPSGQEKIRIEAVDACGNHASDEVAVDRTPDAQAPVIQAGEGTVSREVESGTDMILVSWSVVDDHGVGLVTIDGQQALGRAGVYAAWVPLATGDNTIRIVAKDESGNESAAEVVVTRK